VAAKTIANFIEKASRLYERKRSAVLAVSALEMYIRRWLRWARGGMGMPLADTARTGGVGAFGRGDRRFGAYFRNDRFVKVAICSLNRVRSLFQLAFSGESLAKRSMMI
jgi:hypothetical protein